MEDIAVLTGGKAIFKDLGVQLDAIELSDLGKAKQVRIDADKTVIIEGSGKKANIGGRAEQIRREIENTDSEYDREKLQERLAKLAGGVAQIKVGAVTETEMKRTHGPHRRRFSCHASCHRRRRCAWWWSCSAAFGKSSGQSETQG